MPIKVDGEFGLQPFGNAIAEVTEGSYVIREHFNTKHSAIPSSGIQYDRNVSGSRERVWVYAFLDLTREEVNPMQLKAPAAPPEFQSADDERRYRKQRLAGAFRLFARFGFDEGVAGHITARDPERPDHFWVNPFGKYFGAIRASDLILVNHQGQVVEGSGMINAAAFTIHSAVHQARPDVVAAAHTHSVYGKAWSSLGRLLDPLTQDSCIFYEDHALMTKYTGVVLNPEEGQKIAQTLGRKKAIILQNHGLLTVGQSVDEAAFWFITMERTCQAQLLAEAAGCPKLIDSSYAEMTRTQIGFPLAGWFSFQPLWELIVREEPDLLE